MGDKYFNFIFSSYAITFVVMVGLIVWVLSVHKSRLATIAKLEKQGIRRRSADASNVPGA